MLWERSLVMYDLETGSYWSHLLGEAMAGELEGVTLTQIPSVMTDWGSWYAEYPQTTVLWMNRTAGHFQVDVYERPAEFVIGIVLAGEPAAWSYAHLLQHAPVITELAGFPLIVVLDPDTMTPRVYDRRVDGRRRELRVERGRLTDRASPASWDLISGQPIDPSTGQPPLVPMPAIVSYKNAWMTFHPDSELAE